MIWHQGWDQLPSKYLPNIEATISMNPDWRVYKWDNDSIRVLLKSIGQKYLDKYDSFKILHQKIDYARYAIIFAKGGISIDVDAKAVKSFNEIPFINQKDFIVGYSPLDQVGNIAQGNDRRAINNSVIIARQYHPILKEILDYINMLDCKPGQSDFSCIIFTTGQSFNEILYRHKGEIVILDNSYFEACHGNDEFCEFPANSIIQHKHAQTWVPDGHQAIAKVYYWMKEYRVEIFTIATGVILFFILTLKTKATI